MPKPPETSFPAEEWFTIKEATNYLSISEPTLYRWMRQGKVTFYKVGDATRFKKKDLDQVFEKHTSTREAAQYGLKCIACGHASLVSGTVQSTGKVYFRPDKTRFFTLSEALVGVEARVCPQCGFVQTFADTNKLDKLLKREDRAEIPPEKKQKKKTKKKTKR